MFEKRTIRYACQLMLNWLLINEEQIRIFTYKRDYSDIQAFQTTAELGMFFSSIKVKL